MFKILLLLTSRDPVLRGLTMLTTEDIQKLIRLKARDREAFYRLLEEMRLAHPLDLLLSYTKFKEYAPNV